MFFNGAAIVAITIDALVTRRLQDTPGGGAPEVPAARHAEQARRAEGAS
jgi:hypothetical protein